MQNKISLFAAFAVVVLAAAALYQYRENDQVTRLQAELEQLRVDLAAKDTLNQQQRQDFESQIESLESNLSSAGVQILNLSSALQDARENYFSDLEASRKVIETETELAN
ncbi:MAG: hypothetical protein VYE30_00765 [Pseudomonadota bacterium]|nr:hypothetical protein [Pseudomonadota bacterium]MED5410852.1 hypothetical protein [Pseudomonadota bacterium]